MIGQTSDGTLCRVSFLTKSQTVAKTIKGWLREWPQTLFEQGTSKTAKSAKAILSQATKGDLPDILLVGTPFQHHVWAGLLDIPSGQTMTYGELAKRIGKPKAARAVGTALGSNPVPVLVPCHRIVARTGLGGFTGGLAIKKRLLAAEE